MTRAFRVVPGVWVMPVTPMLEMLWAVMSILPGVVMLPDD